MASSKKYWSPISVEEAWTKITKYCAYQERCHSEVRQKLVDIGTPAAQAEQLLSRLITEGFLNEERFAKLFAGSKFRLKKWGRIKISLALKQRQISPNCIKIAIKEIGEEDYMQTLERLMVKQIKSIQESDSFVKRNKVAKFLIAKGYEPELVWNMLRLMIPD